MDYRSLHLKTVADLRRIAREEGVKVPGGTTKAILVELILEKQRADAQTAATAVPQTATQEVPAAQTSQTEASAPKDADAPKVEATAQRKPVQSPAAPAAPSEGQPVPVEAPQRPAYQRPLSTQQRMGARTQPVPGAYRSQTRSAATARFGAESAPARARGFENQAGYRRPSAGEGPQLSLIHI